MLHAEWFLILCLVRIIFIRVVSQECPCKECMCISVMIYCDDSGLRQMPEMIANIPSGLLYLSMDDNSISTIPEGSLPPNLQNLTFKDNPVSEIDISAFDGSTSTLQELLFSNTNLTKLPEAFGRLRALKLLSISGANISVWNDDVMRSLGQSLQSLNLDNVGLTTWPTWFRYFYHLTDVTISSNSITSLPDDAFDNLTDKITRLCLNGNKLTAVPKAISKLRVLEELVLFENLITDVTWVPAQSPLKKLSLSNNRISNSSQLSQSLLHYSDTLTTMAINKNLLSSIPDFSSLTKIDHLDLSYNEILDPVQGVLPHSLTGLNLTKNLLPAVPRVLMNLYSVLEVFLAYNCIESIQSTDFHNQTNGVQLSYNNISQLTDFSFPTNCSIVYLQLNNNPLSQISNLALSNLPNLAQLNLRNTLITRLPLGLASLTELISFDVSSCTRLVCTCQEKSLASWIKTFNPEGVRGRCGEITVYDFLTIYSKLCP